MSNIIRDYIESAGGNFLTAKNTVVNATVTIQSIRLDDETFNKSYIVVNGTYDSSGEECNIRLGVQNLKRIAEVLGDNENTWISQKLKVLAFQDYPGLGQKGILWVGEKVSHQQSIAQSVAVVDGLMLAVIRDNPQLSMEDVQKMMDEEKGKTGGLISDEAAVNLVASRLGVKVLGVELKTS